MDCYIRKVTHTKPANKLCTTEYPVDLIDFRTAKLRVEFIEYTAVTQPVVIFKSSIDNQCYLLKKENNCH